jgi:dienelactone hydrolase
MTKRLKRLFFSILLMFIFSPSLSVEAKVEYLNQVFKSEIDGKQDAYAYSLPTKMPGEGSILLVYLHGLNNDYTEPFKIPAGNSIADAVRKKFPDLLIMSCNYGKKSSWGTRAARLDITHNIQDFIAAHPVDKIVLVGSAMGGCTAVNYAACAPSYLREKIAGIVAFSPVGELAELHDKTAAPWLKESLEKAFGGKPEEKALDYNNNSFEANMPLFPSKARVCVVSPLQDTVFPTKLQKELVRNLRNRDVDVKVIEVAGDYQNPSEKTVIEGLKFILLPDVANADESPELPAQAKHK